MTFIAPTPSEYDYLDRLDRIRTTARQVASTAQPATAQNLSAIARTYPGISPGLAYAFAASGQQPGQAVESAWQAELATRVDRTPGTIKTPRNLRQYLRMSDREQRQFRRALTPAQRRQTREAFEAEWDADAGGMFGKLPGRIIGGAINVVDEALANAEGGRSSGLPSYRDITRTGAAGLQAGYEAGVGALRLADIRNPQGISTQSPGESLSALAEQTTLGQNIIHGKSMGEGFLPSPSSAAGQAQAEAARKFSPYLIGDHAWTPGRAVAGTILEPDSDAFNIASGLVDGAAAIYADPSALGLAKLAQARAAGKLLVPDTAAREAAGLFSGVRGRFTPQRFSEWATGRGSRVIDNIAAEADPWTISQSLQIPPVLSDGTPIISQLAAASTRDEVIDLLRPHVLELRTQPKWSNPGYGSRLLTDTPGYSIPNPFTHDNDPNIWNEALRQGDLALVNSRASLAQRQEAFKRGIEASSRPDFYNYVDYTFDVIRRQLELNGVDATTAENLARFEKSDFIEAANYGMDASGTRLQNEYLNIAGQTNPLPHPITENQLLNRDVRLPDARTIRRLTSPLAPALKITAPITDIADLAMIPWRRLMLMRPAWGVRVVAEEQLRMAAEGFSSLISAHPLRAIAYAIGSPDDRWITKLEELGSEGHVIAGAAGRGLKSIKTQFGRGTPTTFIEDDAFMRSQHLQGARRFRGIYDENPRVLLEGFDVTRKGDRTYAQGLVEELDRLGQSRINRTIVNAADPQVVKDWFWGQDTRGLEYGPILDSGDELHLLNTIEDMERWTGRNTKPAVFNLSDFAGRDIDLQLPDVEGLLAARLDAADAERIAARIRSAISEVRGTPGAGSAAYDQAMAKYRDAAQDAIAEMVGTARDRGYRVFWDEWTEEGGQAWRELTALDIHQLDPEDLLRSDDMVFVPSDYKGIGRPGEVDIGGVSPGRKIRQYMSADPTLELLGTSRLAADRQMEIATEALTGATASNPTLLDAIRTGEIDGVPLIGRNGLPNEAAVNKIQELVDTGATLPERVRIRRQINLSRSEQSKRVAQLGRITDYFFDAMMPRPSDYLSRSSTFRQSWWERQAELVPYMDGPTRQRLIDELDFANMGRDPIATRIRDMDAKLTGMGIAAPEAHITDFATADTLAKKHALNQTKELLYDLSSRSQVADMGRLIAPFAEAWREVMTRWFRLAYENPQTIRRATQAWWEVHQPGSNAINEVFGDTTPEEGGFFHQDQFGQEVFTYPGSTFFNKNLPMLGVPIPLTGSVQGLNLVGNGLPGLGPAASIPLSYLLPDKPSTDWISNLLFPYGRPSSNPFEAASNAFVPTWAKRLIAIGKDPAGDRQFANATFDAARYLQSTGDYDIQGPDAQVEINRLLSDSKKAARWLFIVRSAGSFTLPTSPSAEWTTIDPKGHLTLQWRVNKWYNDKLRKTGSVTDAMDAFLNKFGVDNILLTQPKSKSVVPAAPVSKAAADWYRTHSDIVEKYPITNGLFAPSGDDSFDSATYEAQFERGERKQLTPQEMTRLANARLANYLYTRAQDEGADAGTLRTLRQDLTEEFPGYMTRSPIQSYDRADVIVELERAAKDPTLRRTKAGTALRYYLEERALAVAKAQKAGLASPWQAKRAYPLRQALREYGEELVDAYPAFQPMWDTTFRHEVGDD